jgi:anti-sigma regulatory factor (Ser/Thr protein kinase)
LEQKGEVRAAEIVRATGFSRVYINRFFQELRDEGKIALVGKANRAHYVLASQEAAAKANLSNISLLLRSKNLVEDEVLNKLRDETGVFSDTATNIGTIVDYAFTEMLNNAIEHSQSPNVQITMRRDEEIIWFVVNDFGVGIFNNIMQKKHLASELEAIQDLLKGKQTTAPEAHSGEGIFFTSKVADKLIIHSSNRKLIFDNKLEDVFVRSAKKRQGTRVYFALSLNAKRNLSDVFRQYTDESYEFSRTRVAVNLYKMDTEYISRSQARRILVGLDKFKTVILDFEGIETIGQAFADEVFRIWQRHHPKIKIIPQHANENIDFMIKRVLPSR